MPILKNLTFTAVPTRNQDPVANRRDKLVERLEEQKALVANASYVRKTQQTVGKDDHAITRSLTERTENRFKVPDVSRLMRCNCDAQTLGCVFRGLQRAFLYGVRIPKSSNVCSHRIN